MKKIFTLLKSLVLIVNGASQLIACGSNSKNKKTVPEKDLTPAKRKIPWTRLVPAKPKPKPARKIMSPYLWLSNFPENCIKKVISDYLSEAQKCINEYWYAIGGHVKALWSYWYSTGDPPFSYYIPSEYNGFRKGFLFFTKQTGINITLMAPYVQYSTYGNVQYSYDKVIKNQETLQKVLKQGITYNFDGDYEVQGLPIVHGDMAITIKANLKPTPKTDQQKANDIKNKIDVDSFSIPNNQVKTLQANISAIKTTLKNDNLSLTDADLLKMSFTSQGDFVAGTPLSVVDIITAGTATATKTLNVIMGRV